MPDCQKCTCSTPPPIQPPRPHDPGDLVFRRTLTWRFPDRSDAIALDRLGEMLSEYVNEMHLWGPEGADDAACHLGAVADDLEDVAAATLFVAELTSDRALILLVSRWAERLAQIAVHMRHVVTATWGGAA